MSALRKGNPWKHGDLNDTLIKLEKLNSRGCDLLRDLLDTLGQIERSLSAVEREDANRAAAQEASAKFRKQFSGN
jgi:hypothetical protein